MATDQPSADRRSPSVVKRHRKSSEKAAKVSGISARSIEKAKTVSRYAPELAEKVATGEMSLNAAYEETRRIVAVGRAAGVDYGAHSRIVAPTAAPNTVPCTHCRGTGRVPA
ncbi:hypothetical protein [Kitasatospora sp. NBC_01302]|uniref:hypothetical protein n=1 Tax=Kitasatospora sp. NBC_01302 TaxID=2903575 RepID=UPI002E1528D1|nr:hypothetical protein OG294_27715 [Kitasatospora sp. NBC_01302]